MVTLPVLAVLLGLGLVISGLTRGDPPETPPTLPAAKIEDGHPVRPPPAPRPPSLRVAMGVILIVVGGFLTYVFISLSSMEGLFKLGRPLRVGGRPKLCRRRRGAGWHDGATPSLDGLGPWRRGCLGERWLAAARAEHASVPAFQRLQAQLVAAGAPEALVARCGAAAADETRHARRCFAVARAYSNIDWTAGPLLAVTDPPADLPSLAIESLIDGCIGEGIAADVARAGAARASDPVIRDSLAMIADDEAAHAELAWDVVAFCLGRGGRDVRHAMRDVVPASCAMSPGVTGLGRGEVRQLASARLARVRARLANMVPAEATAQAGHHQHDRPHHR